MDYMYRGVKLTKRQYENRHEYQRIVWAIILFALGVFWMSVLSWILF